MYCYSVGTPRYTEISNRSSFTRQKPERVKRGEDFYELIVKSLTFFSFFPLQTSSFLYFSLVHHKTLLIRVYYVFAALGGGGGRDGVVGCSTS